ncbi:right-handed parallel beta-helix repeat-containing protein [Treponema denticola]|uniref:right-handed parallel beta-helix repeat-containing protein n=1 Tax=Treponema denticola TaxID=158 RepID=UPI0002B533B6|nr:right-handed parallel beta-helix repeat-containing protein [Treponema denticola]EMB27077.1 polymorphic outer membrane protein [Treponema denticola SP37]EPF33703.1 polymorphic outer membrane protein [Treponema denticola SP44]EPF39745.1 polymorphic outer membrane protein [Treponema denticola SP23]
MKKLLKILTTIAAVLAAALFFVGCKQFLEDPEEFLGYWSSEVVPIDFSIDEPYQMSNDGALCIPSAHDVTLKIKLRNPRKFTLIMPTSVLDAGKVINFPGFPSDQQPVYNTDYAFRQTGDMLELTYNSAFLKAHEWSNGGIGPEITLISTDGRIFNKKFSMNLKADTAPSLEYKGVGKSSDNKYVLIFQVKNMDALLPSPFDHLHGDVKKLHITTEGGSSSDYTVTGINFTAKKINWESDSPFLANATQLVAGEYEGATPLFPAPTDKWLIYFKTDVEVSPSSALKTYEAWLSDGAGLFSNKVQGSTCIRKIGEIKVLENFPKQGGTGSNTTPYLINCVEDGVNLEVWCETPAEDVNILYWTYKQNPEQLIASASGEGTASPTNPLKTIRLPAPSAIGTTIKYKVTFKAIKPGFDPNEKTVYYKLTRVVGTVIDGNKADAWAKLKYAVEHETEPEIIIKNEIKAKGGSIIIGGQTINNDEQINVGRNVKIKGFNTDAVINADSKCRIFSVTSGTLKLNDLKLKNGKAKAGANGGGVYVSNGGTAELSGCAIENCTADLGGGIGASGHVKLTNTSIKTCEATSTTKGGGAVYAKGCTVELTGCTLKGNTARYSGGAIYAEKKDSTPSTVTISGGTIGGTDTNKNIAQNDGGGIWVGESCTLTMKDYAKVIGNKARNGSGGGVYAEGATVNITNCTFKGNETDMNTYTRIGGAIYAKKTDSSLNKPSIVTISGGTIGGTGANDANKATSGGGIWVGEGCTLTMTDYAKVIGNHSNFSGGGIYAYGAIVNITNCTLKGNTAGAASGSGGGGAIYAVKGGSTASAVTIKGGTIGGTGTDDANEAEGLGIGGAIYIGAECTLTMQDNAQLIGNKAGESGGGVGAEGATVNITGGAFKGNTAKRGGAIFANSSSDQAKVTVSGNTTIGGTGTNDANKATGYGTYESGGGIWVGPECELTLEDNVQVINNWAKKNGNGVYVQNASTIFRMKGSAKIDVNSNDVYLEKYDGGAKITVDGTLTPSGGKAARITVPNTSYDVGTQVLKGSISQNYKKFEVTPKGSTPWYVASNGYLTPTQPSP